MTLTAEDIRELVTVEKPESVDSLRQLLQEHGVPVDQWGQGKAKTVDQFFDEINRGESELVMIDGGTLVRRSSNVAVVVEASDNLGQKWVLVEAERKYADGRVVTRDLHTVGGSIGEKTKPVDGGNPLRTATRGLKEELNIEAAGSDLRHLGTYSVIKDSPTYPGLESRYIRNRYGITISLEPFNSEGYKHVDSDTGTMNTFKWVPSTKVENFGY